MKYKFDRVSEWYTGGGIYVMFGKLTDGAWFMTGDEFYDDESNPYILLLDEDAEMCADTDDGSFYYEWQEAHKVGELLGHNGVKFWNQMLQYIIDKNHGNYSDMEARIIVDNKPDIEDVFFVKKVEGYKLLATYEIEDDFCIDIIDNDEDDLYEAYIYHKSYAFKDYMFGVSRGHDDPYDFINDVMYNRYEHMEDYKDKHFDSDEDVVY